MVECMYITYCILGRGVGGPNWRREMAPSARGIIPTKARYKGLKEYHFPLRACLGTGQSDGMRVTHPPHPSFQPRGNWGQTGLAITPK